MCMNNQKGFTLLELIVVVTIIGVLALIAIPQYNSLREKSERAAVISDCSSIFRSFTVYYIDNGEYPPQVGPPPFNLQTLAPLTLDTPVDRLMKQMVGGKAHAYDSPDETLGQNLEFYLIFHWQKNPDIHFVICSSDNINIDGTAGDATTPGPAPYYDSGNWLEGVFTFDNMVMIGR